MEITKISDPTGKVIAYQVTRPDGTQTMYTRFKGGFSWPQHQPAFMLVMGEVMTNQPVEGLRPIHIMEELYEDSLEDLCKYGLLFQHKWDFTLWISPQEEVDEHYPEYFYSYADRRGVSTNLIEPTIHDFHMAIHRIRKRLRLKGPGGEMLKFKKGGKLFEYCTQVFKKGMDEATQFIELHPELMIFASVEYDFEQDAYIPPGEIKTRRRPPSPWAA